MSARVATGLDRIASAEADVCAKLRGRRVGLLAHPASVDARFVDALSILRACGANVAALFGPEHGFGGEAQDMVSVDSELGAERLQIHSLYGSSEEDLIPRAEWLEGLDAVVIDMQDVGARYYTFVWTAALMLKACAARGVQTIVLDRPNPLGGERVEGAPQRPGYLSFVGLYAVPVRHGLTMGELLELVRRIERIDEAALDVIWMRGWRRAMTFDKTGLPWVAPSPNMPTYDTAVVYPGGCLIEGTNLSEGRGTTKPFEIWGAPFIDGNALARDVTVAGAVLRPVSFLPMFQKHARQRCGGIQVHVIDPNVFEPYEAYLRLLAHVGQRCPKQLTWRTEPYEFVADRPAIDLLTGGPEVRSAIDAGHSLEEALEYERRGAAAFRESRDSVMHYQ